MTAPADALSLKEQGNKAFKEHDWVTAVSFYTQAIDLNDKEPTFYTNRAQVGPFRWRTRQNPLTSEPAQAHIKTEAFGLAIADASKAIELDPDNAKVPSCTRLTGGKLFQNPEHTMLMGG